VGTAGWVLGTALFTALAGVAFGALRQISGSVFASMGLHWAANGLGSLFSLVAARVPDRRGRRRGAPDEGAADPSLPDPRP
jgi:hypothetical protein